MAVTIDPSFQVSVSRIYSRPLGGSTVATNYASTVELFPSGHVFQVGDVVAFHGNYTVPSPLKGLDLSGLSPNISGGTVTWEWRHPNAGGRDDLPVASLVQHQNVTGLAQNLDAAGTVEWDFPDDNSSYLTDVLNDYHYAFLAVAVVTSIDGSPVIGAGGMTIAAGTCNEINRLIKVDGEATDTVTFDQIVSGLPDTHAIKTSSTSYDFLASLYISASGPKLISPNDTVLFKNSCYPILLNACEWGGEDAVEYSSITVVTNVVTSAYKASIGRDGTLTNKLILKFDTFQGGWDLPSVWDAVTKDLQVTNLRRADPKSGKVLSNITFAGGNFERPLDTLLNITQKSSTDVTALIREASHLSQSDGNGNNIDVCFWKLTGADLGVVRCNKPSQEGWEAVGAPRLVLVNCDDKTNTTRSTINSSHPPVLGWEAFVGYSIESKVDYSAMGVVGDRSVVASAGGYVVEKELTIDAVFDSGFSTVSEEIGWGFRKIIVLSTGEEYYLTKASGVGGDFQVDRAWVTPPSVGDKVGILPIVLSARYHSTGVTTLYDREVLPATTLRLFAEGMIPVELELELDAPYRLPIIGFADSVWSAASYAAAEAIPGITIVYPQDPDDFPVITATQLVTREQLHNFTRATEKNNRNRKPIIEHADGISSRYRAKLTLVKDGTGVQFTGEQPHEFLGGFEQVDTAGDPNIYVIADMPITTAAGTTSVLYIKEITVPTKVWILVNGQLIINSIITEDTPYMLSAAAAGATIEIFILPEGKQPKHVTGVAEGKVQTINASEIEGMDDQTLVNALLLAPSKGLTAAEGSPYKQLLETLTTDQFALGNQ